MPSYCPVRSDPIAETAREVGSTVHPLSRAAAQSVAMPQPGPHVAGRPSAELSTSQRGQSGKSSSRRPEAPTANLALQYSETSVTMVQPAKSADSPIRATIVSAHRRRPAGERASVGTPSARHDATVSAAIARRRSRKGLAAGQARADVGGVGRAKLCTQTSHRRLRDI